jgi:hypothetical protein
MRPSTGELPQLRCGLDLVGINQPETSLKQERISQIAVMEAELEGRSLAFCLHRDVFQNVIFDHNSRPLQEKFQVGLTEVSTPCEVEVDRALRRNPLLQPNHIIERKSAAFNVDSIGFLVQVHSRPAGDHALSDGALKLLQKNFPTFHFDLCTEMVESLAIDFWL